MILDRLTIRSRITLGTFILALGFFSGTAFVVHGSVERILFESTATLLRNDAAPFVSAIRTEPGESIDIPGAEQLVAVIDPTGRVATSTFPASLSSRLGDISTITTTPQTIAVPDASYLVRAQTVSSPEGDWVIYAARNDAAAQLVLQSITQGLVGGLAALTVLFGAASWFLVSAALRPVERLRRSAEALSESTSNDTLPVGPAQDEVQELARTLNTLIQSLRAATDRERQMVSDASHELRTPLAILQAQLELIRTGDRSTLDADIAAAERAVHRLVRLATALLELSRIEATVEGSRSSEAELDAELVQAVDQARFAGRMSDIAIEYRLDDVPVKNRSASISARGFAQIVENLLGNALAAVGDTGTITAELDRSAHVVTLRVTDSGPGMPEDFIPRAFDRFSQASDSRELHAGTGLGLSIVAALVQSAGGTVTLANIAPSGLVATVTIPIVDPPASTD